MTRIRRTSWNGNINCEGWEAFRCGDVRIEEPGCGVGGEGEVSGGDERSEEVGRNVGGEVGGVCVAIVRVYSRLSKTSR